jgi:aspartate/methionine/tyrosine aminotransferase
LSESGVEPLSVGELGGVEDLVLGYGHTKGLEPLRRTISSQYGDIDPEGVVVTNGGSEANHVATLATVKRGDEVVVEMPNYMQLVGLLRGHRSQNKVLLA